MDFTQIRHEFPADRDHEPTSTTPAKRFDVVHGINITNQTGHDLKLTKETEDDVYHNPNNKSWEADKRPPLLIKNGEVVRLYFADKHTPKATITYESPDDKNVKIEINVNGDHQYVRLVYKDANNMDSYYLANVQYSFIQLSDPARPDYIIHGLDVFLLKVTLSKNLEFEYTRYDLDHKQIARKDSDENITIGSDGRVKFTPTKGEFDPKRVEGIQLRASPKVGFFGRDTFHVHRTYVLPHNGEDIDLAFPAIYTAPGMKYGIWLDITEEIPGGGLAYRWMKFEFDSELIKPE